MIVVHMDSHSAIIDGHAGYAEKGNDIVCAAVSVLAQNLVNSIEALTEDDIQCHFRDGHMEIYFEDLSEQGCLLIDSFFIGICAVQKTYGDAYVKLI